MDYDFFDINQTESLRQVPGISYIRLFHASPGTPAADVYANNKLIAGGLSYGQFTEYMPLAKGTYNIEVYPAGQKNTPILRINLPISDKQVFTLAVIGILPRIGILPVEDEYETLAPGRVNIRFANLSPNSGNLDLVLRGGPAVFTNIGYTEVSDYRSFPPGRYNFFVRPSNSTTNLLLVPVNLLPRRNLTFYFVGSQGIPPGLQVYIPMDGTTYLRG
ncbi:hypothetical protein Cpap_2673 [Ruminiclostridium papyrosolvens DSM 2782]|uniref:DUF4397 domain-containing protein n=1 Tax=Ruminiclostridium papyrosolvens DSM 2782 TaxID=588581 RepID=F1TC72_9FIRM|nr:DUF4397 domain-containing protein [Ruminiclostridium papyrosolvens]EGD47987.1 hypothetical protein Cpap_2673 [Ruminiclostridium papyrosolvens DSM 2782]WES35122.1 DUF4397 domain-containing protein [Ruminiclostridium papyrosolvens DSM 2782]